MNEDIICAACGEQTRTRDVCDACGASPLLDDRYRLLETLGQGGVGTTYLAERISDGLRLAVKEVLVRRLESVKAMELADREAEVLRRLQHAGVPRYYDHFTSGEGKSTAYYLVQENIEGATLEQEARGRTYSDEEILAIGVELLEIVAVTSDRLVHRDIKPANIIRRAENGNLVLIDFGSVRELAHSPTDGSTITGTVGFMAPEQLWGRATTATDIYGVGMTMLWLKLGGQLPEGVRDNSGALAPTLKLGYLRRALAPLTHTEPGRRPQSAEAALRVLRQPYTTSAIVAPTRRAGALARTGSAEIITDRYSYMPGCQTTGWFLVAAVAAVALMVDHAVLLFPLVMVLVGLVVGWQRLRQ